MKIALIALAILLPLLTASAEPLRIGLTGKYPPFNYYNPSGQLVGFDVDVSNELCQRMKRDCVFVPLQWDGMLASLLAGKIDMIVGSMAITDERSKEALFSHPYYESGAQVFSLDENADLTRAGFKIGVTLGTTYETAVRKRYKNAAVKTYKGDATILEDLKSGRLDAMITDKLVGGYMAKQVGIKLFTIGPVLYEEKIGIPVRPSETLLATEINSAVDQLRSASRYRELIDQYFGLKVDSSISQARSTFNWPQAVTLLLKGLIATVKISLIGILLGLIFSAGLTFLLLAQRSIFVFPAKLFTDFVRSTPFLIQLFAIYFGFPAIGIVITAFWAAVLAIAIHSAAYLAEVWASGFRSIPLAQRQAARLLGISPFKTFTRVVFPQMLPIVTPSVLNTVVAMIKDSSIVSVISVYELTMQAQQLISATYRPFIFYFLAAILYAAVTYPLILLGRRLAAERKEIHAHET
jgi:His/Glu/Gln/Arg/opine family amino acid ABC transporter permease subunit